MPKLTRRGFFGWVTAAGCVHYLPSVYSRRQPVSAIFANATREETRVFRAAIRAAYYEKSILYERLRPSAEPRQ